MSDADIDALALAPGTEALIESLLRQHGPLHRPRAGAPDASLLVRYLCHVLPWAEARQVEQGLTASSESRRAVQEVRLVLDRLQALSWAETTAIGQGSSREAEIARAWMALAAQTPKAVTPDETAPNAFGREFWAEGRDRAEGSRAQGLRTTLLAFGAQWQALLRRPQLALVRGSADPLPVYGTGQAERRLLLTARLDAAGTLHAAATLDDLSGAPASDFAGWSAYLGLLAGGEALLCAASTLEGDRVAWTAAGVGSGIGQGESVLAAGGLIVLLAPLERRALPVPSLVRFSQELLAEGFLVASAEPPPESEEVVGLLAANILTVAGLESKLPPAPWEVLGPAPRTENGQLAVVVRLPAITRSAYAETHRLLLDIAVAPNEWQRLDSWPVKEWGAAARALSISCPGREDGVLASLTLLRVRLAPLEVGRPDTP